MTTVTSRLAIDVLRSARVRRETYVGDWLPEPLVEPEAPAVVEAEESVSLAMLVLLERLNPVERAVFVLRESFDVAFDADRRDRRPLRGQLPPDPLPRPQARRRRAARASTPTRPSAARSPRASSPPPARATCRASSPLLAPDAVLIGDGGGIARSIPHPMRGAAAIARALVAFYGQVDALGVTLEPVWVNGQPGFRTVDPEGRLVNVVGLDIVDGRVASIYSMLNPEKLGHLGETSELGLRPSAQRRVAERHPSSGRSVMNMWPGAWVIISEGRLAAATAWGVTPQAQKTGTSPSWIVTGSPNCGLARSAIPSVSGSPMWTGAPWAVVKRLVISVARIAWRGVIGRIETTSGPLKRPAGWRRDRGRVHRDVRALLDVADRQPGGQQRALERERAADQERDEVLAPDVADVGRLVDDLAVDVDAVARDVGAQIGAGRGDPRLARARVGHLDDGARSAGWRRRSAGSRTRPPPATRPGWPA